MAASTKKPTSSTTALTSAARQDASSRAATPLREAEPEWLLRVFRIETGMLVACDARWDGEAWRRDEEFTFLYRSRRNKFFVLKNERTWRVVTTEEAKQLYERLAERLMTAEEVFETPPELEILPRGRDDDDDERSYKIVRNDRWEFSIWLDYKALPPGWRHIGVTGPKSRCLDFIRRNCVFAAPNPGIP